MKNLIILFSLVQFTTYASWKYLTTEDGITIYTKEAKDSIMPFMASGNINANIATVIKTLKDFNNKNKWSPKLKSVKIHKMISENKYQFSEYYQTPWPATDREFLLEGELKQV